MKLGFTFSFLARWIMVLDTVKQVRCIITCRLY